jgi:hypothetical protein
VLIARRSYFRAQSDYLTALVSLWQRGIEIQGYLLVGGLDSAPTKSAQVTEGGANHE